MQDINMDEQVAKKHLRQNSWEKISYYLLLVLVFLLPFWFAPVKGFSLDFGKFALIFVLALLSLGFYLIHTLQEGKIRYIKSLVFGALILVVLTSFLSSLFSGLLNYSILGAKGESESFIFLLILALLLFLTSVLLKSDKRILTFFSAIMLSSVVLFITQILRSVFGFGFWGVLPNKTSSLVGNWNELAIFFGFLAFVSLMILEVFGKELLNFKSGRLWRRLLFFLLAFSLAIMIFVNFTAAWLVLGLFMLVFFIYLFSSFEKRNFISLPFFILLFCLVFILARPLVGDLLSALGLQNFEVNPSWSATMDVTKQVFSSGIKNIFLGSGPNTFVYDWIKFKPAEISLTVFWDTRFANGVGFLPTMLSTTGVLGSLAWLIFLVSFLVCGLKTLNHSKDKITNELLFGSFIASMYLWVFGIIYSPTKFLLTLTFLMTGLFFALAARGGYLKMGEFIFVGRAALGFIFSLGLVLALIVAVSGFYVMFQKYLAAYYYARGIEESNVKGNLVSSEDYLSRAARFDKQDFYYRALGDLGLAQLSSLMRENLSQSEARSRFQSILAAAIQNAQTAININPTEPLNLFALANIYENLVPVQIDGARVAALNTYAKITEISPFDPSPLLGSARVEIYSGNNSQARSYIAASLAKKNNYTPALYLLARLAAQDGNLDEAIAQTEAARLTAPNDVSVLFQLGMFYYQKKDYASARDVLERTVALDPNYSNARYFLGLIYDRNGNKQAAIEQFKVIKSLNPDNDEVKRILANLQNGRSALSTISPPESAPEDRNEPPVNENR